VEKAFIYRRNIQYGQSDDFGMKSMVLKNPTQAVASGTKAMV